MSYIKSYESMTAEILEKMEFENFAMAVAESSDKADSSSFNLFARMRRTSDVEIEDVVDEMFGYMRDKGYNKSLIKTIVKKYHDRIVNIPWEDSSYNFIHRSAHVDVFLYYLTGGDFQLSGYRFDEVDDDDKFIKYSYGYHRTNFGQLYLEQIYLGSSDPNKDFKEEIAGDFIPSLIDWNMPNRLSGYFRAAARTNVNRYNEALNSIMKAKEKGLWSVESNKVTIDKQGFYNYLLNSGVTDDDWSAPDWIDMDGQRTRVDRSGSIEDFYKYITKYSFDDVFEEDDGTTLTLTFE